MFTLPLTPEQRKAVIVRILRQNYPNKGGLIFKKQTRYSGVNDADLMEEFHYVFYHSGIAKVSIPFIRFSPHAGKYVAAWKKAKENAILYAETPHSADFRRTYEGYTKALHNRINSRGQDHRQLWRKWESDYQRGLYQDQQDIHNRLTRRVRFYQFRTPELYKRFAHLLSDRNEDY